MKRLELCDGVQSWVSRVKRRGLSTHPWGAPVFSVMVLDVLMPTRTAWGLPVRKSNNQLHREVLSPSWANLWVSCWGMIVLNAELKSMNSILTYESFLSRYVRAGWRAVAMVGLWRYWIFSYRGEAARNIAVLRLIARVQVHGLLLQSLCFCMQHSHSTL